jgi:hypothetical protein
MSVSADAGANAGNLIPLKIAPELELAPIIVKFVFDTKTKSIVLELNHKYKNKKIICKIVKDDLHKTQDKFKNLLKSNGMHADNITKITDVIDNNYQVILGSAFEEEQSSKKKCRKPIQKFRTEECLAEAVIVGGKSYFAIVARGGISLEKSLDDLIPPSTTSYMNRPYVFKSKEEFDDMVEKAKHETLDTLYHKTKSQWRKYSTDDDAKISLCAADTIFTYFQDELGMTHYLFFVGAPDSGKSNRRMVLNFLAYRNMMSTDITPSNIYRFLGSVQEGQGTICEDEADDLDDFPQKMKIYKSGYTKGFRVPRNEDEGSGRSQDAYCTFGFKAYAAERVPDTMKAKGLKQRVVEMKCLSGTPEWDISEVANPASADEFVQHLNELNVLRNILFAMIVREKKRPYSFTKGARKCTIG